MTPLARTAATAPRTVADWALGGLGLGVATASASFAAYMIVLSPPVTASGQFRIFAQFDHRYRAPSDGPGPLAAEADAAGAAASPAPGLTRAADASGVDPMPTGSVASAGRISQSGVDASRSSRGSYTPDGMPLPDFALRDVFDGHALVESRSSLSVVRPGSLLEGAGHVLSIERRGEQWVVVTDKGLIAGQRR